MTGRRSALVAGLFLLAAAVFSAACGGVPPAVPAPPLPAAAGSEPEAFSLLGEPLPPPPLPPEVEQERSEQLAAARARHEADPDDADALVWFGRRTAYLGRYREAVAIFTRGVERFPDDPRFLRHRGHRFITLRRFEAAEADLERAAAMVRGRTDEVEPDGLPNARGIPTSTLKTNVAYHLGLARYFQGDFEGALEAYRECLGASANPDMLVATSYWLYLTLRRLDRAEAAARVLAPIGADLEVIENGAYQRLLLMYRGELSPEALLTEAEAGSLDFATIGYGVGAWHRLHGRRAAAEEVFRRVVAAGQWAAFGQIAAEAELARGRLGRLRPP